MAGTNSSPWFRQVFLGVVISLVPGSIRKYPLSPGDINRDVIYALSEVPSFTISVSRVSVGFKVNVARPEHSRIERVADAVLAARTLRPRRHQDAPRTALTRGW
jgi:hypothetical protein